MEQILDSENDLEQRLHTYEPLWNEWVLTGKIIGKGEYTTDFEICRAANGTCEYEVLKAVNITAGDSDDVSLPISIVEQLRNSNRMITHDNIVSYDDDLVYGVYDNNGKIISYDLLLREEYLTSILNIECSTFSSDESLLLRLAEDILTALLYSHEIGLYHGGIKPQNIFVTSSGSFKLADFAVREIFSALIPTRLEASQSITYFSPETAVTDGIGQSTAASDIYSLGLILYYLLNNGLVPFSSNESDTAAAASKRFSGENILPPENGSKVLVDIVLKALAFRPKDRYRNAGEMLADIKALKEKTLDSTPQYTENNSRTESSYFTTTINADAETSFLRGPDKLYPDGVYSGSFQGDIRSGLGKMSYNNGDVYDGSWDGDKPDGRGIYAYSDGSVYEGEFRQGQRYGTGKMTWSNGDVYVGSWMLDIINGRGTYTWKNGDIYEGAFVDSVKEGYGTMRYSNGEVYEGNWKNDVRNGSGKLTNAKNGYRSGVWENDTLVRVEKVSHEKTKPLFIAAPAAVLAVVLVTVLIAVNIPNEPESEEYSSLTEFSQLSKESDTDTSLDVVKKYSDGTYVGEVLNEKRHSHGTFTWNNGDVYDGEWSNDKMNGEGVFTWAEGSKYTGTFVDNIKSGQGTMVSTNGNTYTGSWENDMQNGSGEMTYADGSIYTGNWYNDRRNGSGKLTLPNGDYYDGNWSNDNKSGAATGQETSEDGSVYIGDFMDGVRAGDGKLTVANNFTYEGAFLNGTMNGFGTANFDNGDTYKGDWSEGKRVGHGTYTFKDGGVYIGDFALNADGKSVMQGQGKRAWADGLVFEGTYVNGKRNGEGTLTREDGSREVGTWKDDKMNGFFKVYEANGLVYEGTVKNNKGQVVCTTDPTKVINFN